MMCKLFGHLEGVINKIEQHDQGHLTFEVLAVNGVTCYASDIYGLVRQFPIEVGMKICLEEADVTFDNGRIEYCVHENLRGVVLNGVAIEHFIPRKSFHTL